jgi:hypothetical protein
MELRKFVACTVCVVTTAIVSAGCADGTGQALTPTLPSADSTSSNADGTKLKAGVPQPMSPRSATRVSNLTPQLVLQNASGTFDPSIALSYVFEVFEGETSVVKSDPISAGSPQTIFNVPSDVLKLNTTYAWYAYAVFPGVQGSLVQGSISDVVSFRTPLPPPPIDLNTPGPVPCGGNTGPAIVACVGAAFPQRLVKTSGGDFSDERRFANMEFIRDAIIETGRCRGLNLGRNFKRGTPVISRDFIVWRRSGQPDNGIDIASGYDAVGNTLKLTWQVLSKDRNYGHPFWAGYPKQIDCSAVQ